MRSTIQNQAKTNKSLTGCLVASSANVSMPASYLEGVKKAHPVADLVHRGVADIVAFIQAAWHRVWMNDRAICKHGTQQ